MPIENILAAWWNPVGDMNSLTSISASDLIWQMDTYYTISYDRCARQWSTGCCHFEFRNKTSPSKFLLSCAWSSRSAWICALSFGRILVEVAGKLAMLKTVKLHPQYIHQAVPRRQNERHQSTTFSFEHSVWPFSVLSAISIVQTHNSCNMEGHDSH